MLSGICVTFSGGRPASETSPVTMILMPESVPSAISSSHACGSPFGSASVRHRSRDGPAIPDKSRSADHLAFAHKDQHSRPTSFLGCVAADPRHRRWMTFVLGGVFLQVPAANA